MEIDLSNIGMHEGQQYEVIISTIDKNGKSNAAPFGLRVLGRNEIFLRIFEGGKTIKNIKDNEEFIVNISRSPLMFTLSSTGTIPEEYLSRSNDEAENPEIPHLTDADAYFRCKVKSIKTGFRENDHIKDTEVNFIKAEAICIEIKNKCVKPLNRALPALIEALVNYSRIGIVDGKTQEDFLKRFKESERIIKRVGNAEEKESIQILKDELIKQGYEIQP